ncbi:MAG: RdgB/HAM1 family non-canonical purine NTP pyrophosphatase [Marinicaulis sp.]|nr:RdgB/HAM1 family non-canonical purine NTP pyrophosphatase [Marinicaulis sp.]NNL88640.1 RdgB/HAM1 family non-canonical purine NTP pyrophosphatase [Marinicaulis sp.]
MGENVRKLAPGRLVVASHNNGKVREINELLRPFGIFPVTAKELSLDEPEETGKTFAKNAEIKAIAAAKASNLPTLADDSGLCVEALGGAPGIYSARWAGPDKQFTVAMARIKDELERSDASDAAAYFCCVLCIAWPDRHAEFFEGRVDGSLVFPPRGEKGFGYDPIFVPDGYDKTFAEFDPADKQKISHRANAFRKLIDTAFVSI